MAPEDALPGRKLAHSLWPRASGDGGNRRLLVAAGPSEAVVSAPLALPGTSRSENAACRKDGGVISDDGSLRVTHGGFVSRVHLDGRIEWTVSLEALEPSTFGPEAEDAEPVGEDEPDIEDEPSAGRRSHHSLPTALEGGRTLLTASRIALVLDANGGLERHIECGGLDDSGPSPSVTGAGLPILTTMYGEVQVWEEQGLREVGVFGYDIVPPALFDDDSLAISGYAHRGFCRARTSGELVWKTGLEHADLLPTVSRAQRSAAGSANARLSGLYSEQGELLGEFAAAAVFAEYLDGGWIAQSEECVARLDARGRVLWQADMVREIGWGCYGPIVDLQGAIYVQDGEDLVSLDPDGSALLRVSLGARAGPVFPAAPGILAVVSGGELRFIGRRRA